MSTLKLFINVFITSGWGGAIVRIRKSRKLMKDIRISFLYASVKIVLTEL